MSAPPDTATRIARNAALKVAVQATRLISLALLVATARTVGPAEFGKFSFAYALATILGVAVDFGIPVVLTRQIARAPEETAARWATAAALKLGLLGLAAPVYLAVPLLARRPWDVTATVWLLGLAIGLQAFIENAVAVCTGFQRLQHEVMVRVVEKLVLGVAGFGALALGGGVLGVAGAFVLAAAVSLALAIGLVERRLASLRAPWSPRAARRLAGELAPVAQAQLLGFATARLAPVVVALMAGDRAAGLFGAAFRLYDVVQVAPVALIAAVYPELARTAAGTPRFRSLATQAAEVLVLALLPVTVVLGIGAPAIAAAVYGPGYGAAAPLLALLGAAVTLATLQSFLGAVFLALDRPERLRRVAAGALGASLVATPVLVGAWGAWGGAVAVLLVEAVGVTGSLVGLHGLCGLPLARGAAKGLLAALVAMAAAALVPGGAARIVAALAVYAGGLALLRAVPATVWGSLRRGLLRRPAAGPAERGG
jgi:O-antigen/teichoic acid export membrane protein